MKKNVIFRSGSLRMGGLERVLVEVIQNIDREKYNVNLLITDDSGNENIFLKDIPKDVPIYFLKPENLLRETEKYRKGRKNSLYKRLMYNIYKFKEDLVIEKNTKKALNEIRKKHGEIDIFIDYDWGATKYIDKLNLKKKVVWIHNSIPNLLGHKLKKIERFGKRLSKYDVVVAICDDMKREIEEIYPYLNGRVKRVYNPFNFERIRTLGEDKEGLTEEQKKLITEDYIIAVSRLDTVQKDYATLIKGYKHAVLDGVKEKLYIVGDGQDRKEIEKLILDNGLEKNIILIGNTKNPYVWMKNSKLFVHSSKYEGLPTVLIEAMICGRVVISSDCPTGPKEILEDGDAGVLFPVGDYEALSLGLKKLLISKFEKEKYEKIIKARILEFKSDVVIKKYQEIIEEE